MRFRRQPATPESSPGGPTYDATLDPQFNYTEQESLLTQRLRSQIALFHSPNRLEPAPVTEGNRIAGAFAMLGVQRDLTEAIRARRWEHPFPGVALGDLPSFARSPGEPVMGGVGNVLSHHAHLIESQRATRARFGH